MGYKGPIAVPLGTTLSVSVSVPGFRVDPPVDTVEWDGKMASTAFVLYAGSAVLSGAHIGTATISAATVPIALVRFELTIGETQLQPCLLDTYARPISTMFASYAAEDRVEVLQWARGAQAAGVDVFLDVLALREGECWETELFRHVPTRDLFCLFWSAPASTSEWVEKEWRCALVSRGLDYIHPVPLADPRVVPPLEELRAKHFSSVPFVIREYEKGLERGLSECSKPDAS